MGSVGKIFGILFGLLMLCVFAGWSGTRIYKAVVFNIDCGGHLKRAADANTIELATRELKTVIDYAEKNKLTEGYTSILYKTPDEDIGFWYQNLKASLGELESVSPNATQLEKSNLLMKLRETLLDLGQSPTVTVPDGISIFPFNTVYAVVGIISFIFGIVGVIGIGIIISTWD